MIKWMSRMTTKLSTKLPWHKRQRIHMFRVSGTVRKGSKTVIYCHHFLFRCSLYHKVSDLPMWLLWCNSIQCIKIKPSKLTFPGWNIELNLDCNVARGAMNWPRLFGVGGMNNIRVAFPTLYQKINRLPCHQCVELCRALTANWRILFWSSGNFIEHTWQNWNWLEYWVPMCCG